MSASTGKSKAKPVRKSTAPKAQNATALLRADHKLVSDVFADFEKARTISRKKKLAEKICMELTVHAQVEEEIFYPAFKVAVKDKELVPEAVVEHASLKVLIAQIEDEEPDDEMFDAKMKVLSEYVKHHVKEEQSQMFTQAKTSHMDLVQLGAQIASRKRELIARLS